MSSEKKLLVVGSGGREHAIVSTLRRSPSRPEVFCAPGNAGIAAEAECVPIDASDAAGIGELLEFARSRSIDWTFVGPEAPLVAGIVDQFEAAGQRIVGPPAAGARLEGSKIFSKEFFRRHEIPTADFAVFDDADAARRHVESRTLPMVLKADGLAAGKGVIVAQTRQEALDALDAILVERRFGEAGARLLVEDCLVGPELSIMILTDGESWLPMETAQDYKPAFDGGTGPNTGGMGAFSPALSLGDRVLQAALADIVRPTISGLRAEGIHYKGVLYAGLMLTADGPKILEYNVRFGDPETQPILTRLRSDFVEVLEACLEPGGLARTRLEWDPRTAVCVVAVSDGYPGSYPKGREIRGLDGSWGEDTQVYHAGTSRATPDGPIVTAGGRVLGVTSLGENRAEARARAYRTLEGIEFDGLRTRSDIGAL